MVDSRLYEWKRYHYSTLTSERDSTPMLTRCPTVNVDLSCGLIVNTGVSSMRYRLKACVYTNIGGVLLGTCVNKPDKSLRSTAVHFDRHTLTDSL